MLIPLVWAVLGGLQILAGNSRLSRKLNNKDPSLIPAAAGLSSMALTAACPGGPAEEKD